MTTAIWFGWAVILFSLPSLRHWVWEFFWTGLNWETKHRLKSMFLYYSSPLHISFSVYDSFTFRSLHYATMPLDNDINIDIA